LFEQCFNYLGCKNKDCIMHGQAKDSHCWEVEGTECNHIGIKYVQTHFKGSKISQCIKINCLYIQYAIEHKILDQPNRKELSI